MDFTDIERAFCEELQKIGASNMHVSQTRTGRRSISAANLLKKDQEGTLFKHAPKPVLPEETQGKVAAFSYDMPYETEVRPKRKKNDPPSREDADGTGGVDQRSDVTTIPSAGGCITNTSL